MLFRSVGFDIIFSLVVSLLLRIAKIDVGRDPVVNRTAHVPGRRVVSGERPNYFFVTVYHCDSLCRKYRYFTDMRHITVNANMQLPDYQFLGKNGINYPND